MQRWGRDHFKAALRVLRYLHSTKSKALVLNPTRSNTFNITAYCDANYGDTRNSGNEDKYKPQGGYLIFMNDALVAWQSKRHVSRPHSSMESEFVEADHTGKSVMWWRHLMNDLGYPQSSPTIMYEDNKSCIDFVKMNMNSQRSRHIDMRMYWLRDWVKEGSIELWHVLTQYQLADILTKYQPVHMFKRMANEIMTTRCIPPHEAHASCKYHKHSEMKID